MAAWNKCWLLCALCCVVVACVEARKSHKKDQTLPELFIFNELCAFKDESGPCKALIDRYFFNIDTNRCEIFEYGGCGGNDNNFETLEKCEEACVVSDDKNPCHLPEAPGPCRGLFSRYLFDSQTQQCRHFFYGGCFGNANNFRSMTQCRDKCQSRGRVPTERPTAASEVHTHAATRPDHVQPIVVTEAMTGPLVQQNRTREHPKDEDVCLNPIDRGTCDGALKRFAYNPSTKRCQVFEFSGCGGNANNFVYRRHCLKKCVARFKEHMERYHRQKGEHGGANHKMIRIRKKNLGNIVSRSV